MTAYERDPDGVLEDGCRVRTAEEGGIEGRWFSYEKGSYAAGCVFDDDRRAYGVPRGLEQHLIVLREVVDNRPTEPGRYEVTWFWGEAAAHGPLTRTEDGRWLNRHGDDWTDNPHLRRASFRRLPDRPTEPGWWAAVTPRDRYLLRLGETTTWHWRTGDDVSEKYLADVTAWYRVSDEPWSPT